MSFDSPISRRTVLASAAGLALALATPVTASAAGFGYTDDGTHYVVDTGAGLVFKVDHGNGDLSSFVYKGTEYQGYGGRNSHIESGLGASTVTISTPATGVVLIKVVHGTLIHYYAARSGENNIYLFTYKADTSVTASRYIARLKPGIFPTTYPDTWSNSDTVIESADVFAKADGTTRSKHFANLRTIDYDYFGFSASAASIWVVRSNKEKDSGGPFVRQLLRHGNESGAGLYEHLYYAEGQTEAERFGLHGPYVLAFTDGSAPTTAVSGRDNTAWVDALGLTGWTGASGRGRIVGNGLAGRDTSYPYVVGVANAGAQYWAKVDASTGKYTVKGILPGTYTLTVYKGELAVHTENVTVTAGAATTLHTITITGDPAADTAIWRIGDWNGTPAGFRNASHVTYAHPSDSRAAAWTAGTFVIGTSTASAWPAYQFKEINQGLQVSFTLTAAQAAADRTLRIGITTAKANGRPQITVNNTWTSALPAAAAEPSTRTLTVGSYRGNNHTYEYVIPAAQLLTGTNTLRIDAASGSAGGGGYLSPSYGFDALDLL
ncbi:rhamnogalacturonan lyase B N-terminal domain-containing protein [Streptomyces caeruleatus]|uniref:rhamnogalacturonan endolyase n=1 Tax=Streptomyces caeruleatus TaxID=661399 RepID=A0A117RKF3_9ACTN|nr:rhamnogalacturonan lyase B N-terminal domain-containing protein [Streptomyces caeruleatus]KUN95701.1 rhamnogalacturonase B precursor [Streptomyces caeruleatus]